jgi:glutaminase
MMVVLSILKRSDEMLIRQLCDRLKLFLCDCISESELKSLINYHHKETGMILHKIAKVKTFYTQMKLLEVLNIAFSVLDDNGASINKKERIFAHCDNTKIRESM